MRLSAVPPGVQPAEAVPVARTMLSRAMNRVGPDGIGDVESRLEAAAEAVDEVARGGTTPEGKVEGGPSGKTYPVRICDPTCSERVGGRPGCSIYRQWEAEYNTNIDGRQCERDLAVIRELEGVFSEGNESRVRELAGRFTGAVVLQIENLLTRIIADGACVEVPIIDVKGTPVFNEEIMYDEDGEVVYGPPNSEGQREPRIIRTLMTKKMEHPLFPTLTKLLKETRLIDLSQYELTPKSSSTPPATDGMILTGQDGDEQRTLNEVAAHLKSKLDESDRFMVIAGEKRGKDPAYKKMSRKQADLVRETDAQDGGEGSS